MPTLVQTHPIFCKYSAGCQDGKEEGGGELHGLRLPDELSRAVVAVRSRGYLPPVLAAAVLYDTAEPSAAHPDVILTSFALSLLRVKFNFIL